MTTILLLPLDPTAPAHYVRVDADGGLLAHGPWTPPPAAPVPVVLAVPGVEVHLRWLALPARSPAQTRAAARLRLAEHLAGDAQALHLAFAPAAATASAADGAEQPRLTAVVDPDVLRDWLARAAALGAAPQCVVPDCLLLPAPPPEQMAVAVWDGRWLLRGTQLACSLEPDIARLLGGDALPPVPPSDPAQVLALLAPAARQPPLDLLQFEFAPAPRSGVSTRRLLALAALLLLSPLLLLLAQTLRYEIGARALQARAAAGSPGDAQAALRARAQAEAGAAAFATRLDTLFDALRAVPGVVLAALDDRAGGTLAATVDHADADALAGVVGRLEDAGWQVQVRAEAAADGRARSVLTVESAP